MIFYKDEMKELQLPELLFDGSSERRSLKRGWPHLIGFGFDGTACFRKGSRYGPDEIREASYHIETYSPYLDRDTTEVDFIDLGNLPVGYSGDITSWASASGHFFSLLEEGSILQDTKFLTLGGEHSISYAPIVCYLQTYPSLVLLHLDAHGDLRSDYQGFKYSHASLIRRVWEHFGNGHQLVQYGIRSGSKEEYDFMRKEGTLKRSRNEFIETVIDIPSDRPIYLTLDLDYFDPAYLPGTGTPEPGGEDFHSFVKLVKILFNKNLVGADVVELAGSLDPTGNSSVFAAKVVRELILAISERP